MVSCQSDVSPLLQSAYRPQQSTEMALLKVMYDAILAADQSMVILVVLIDCSAVFDAADHTIALNTPQKRFDVSLFQWFKFTVT